MVKCTIFTQEIYQRYGFSKGHTNDDPNYCIIKYKHIYFVHNINPFPCFPQFVLMRKLPLNIKIALQDLKGLQYHNDQDRAIVKRESLDIVMQHLDTSYTQRTNEFDVIVSHWIRISNIACLHIMDINIQMVIKKYHYLMRFDEERLRITLDRYIHFIPFTNQ